MILFLYTCSTKNETPDIEQKNIYDVFYFHIELPKKYYVEKNTSSRDFFWADTVKNSNNMPILYFSYGGGFSCNTLSDEFEESSRREFFLTDKGQSLLVRNVHLSGFWVSKEKDEAWAYCLDFYYYPNEVDTSICEKIIRSAKIQSFNKDYLCNIYMIGNASFEGEKMSRLRNHPVQDLVTLIKNFELEPVNDQDYFTKKGKFLFLADCYLDNRYKGSFSINNLCEIEWNGKKTDKKDVKDLLNTIDSEFAKKIKNKCGL
jgi:hypothetical protein